MKEKIAYKITFILFITFLYSMLAFKAVYVYAETDDEEESMQIDDSATNGNYDYTQYEELTQSFYIPKSSFMSSYDYEKYCERMGQTKTVAIERALKQYLSEYQNNQEK